MDSTDLQELWAKTFGPLDAASPLASFKPARDLNNAITLALVDRPPAETLGAPQPIPSSSAEDRPLLESLRIKELLGEGGMGKVFRAEQLALGRDIALKKIAGRGRGEQLDNFIAEARITARLDHPNIVPVHDLRQGEDGELVLAMKLVNGKEWSRLIHPEGGEESAPLDRHLEILLKVCDAVAFAHSRGIVHCDLKPENVMVGEFGEVLVMDWGIALAFEDSVATAEIPRVSETCQPRGTPVYMAPELAEGRGADIGPWTDAYLIGAILYEIIEGAAPHKAPSLFAVLSKAALGEPDFSEGRAPDELVALCRRAMARAPAERFASVEALQEAVRAFRSHSESRLIAVQARSGLEKVRARARDEQAELGRDALYAGFAEAVAGFRQAAALWPENPEARAGEDEARRAFAEASLAFGDLGLAEAQGRQLADGAALLADISAARARMNEVRRSRRVLRRAVRGLAAALVLGLGVAAAVLYRSERGARRSAAAAEESQAQAEASRVRAEELRCASERARGEALARLGEVFVERAQAARRGGDPFAGRDLLRQAFATLEGSEGEAAKRVLARAGTEWTRAEVLDPKRLWTTGQGSAVAPSTVIRDARGRLLVWSRGRLAPLNLEEGALGPAIEVDTSGRASILDIVRGDEYNRFALSPDRRSFAVIQLGLGVRVFALDEDRSLLLSTNDELESQIVVDRVAFCPGASMILTGSAKEVAVWSGEDGRFLRRIPFLTNSAIFGDARRERFYAVDHRGDLVTVSLDGRRLTTLELPGDRSIDAAAVSRDGRWLALAIPWTDNRLAPRLRIIDLAGEEPKLGPSIPLKDRLTTLVFGEGALLAAADRGGRIERWEASSGRSLGACETRRPIDAMELLSGGEQAVLVGDGALALWDLAGDRALRRSPPRVIDFVLRSEDLLVLRSHDGGLQSLDPETGRPRGSVALPIQPRARRFLRMAAGGKRVAIVGREGDRLALWVFADEGRRLVFERDVRGLIAAATGPKRNPFVYQQIQQLVGLALSPGGRWLAIASQQALILCDLDAEGGAPRMLALPELDRAHVSLAPGDRGFRSLLSFDGEERLVASLGRVVTFRLPDGAMRALKVGARGALGLADGGFLARQMSGDVERYTSTGDRIYGRPAEAASLAVSPRPARFAVGGRDGSLSVYGLDDGSLQTRVAVSSGAITRLAFPADRERVYGLDSFGELRAWRLSGLELRVPLLDEEPSLLDLMLHELRTLFRPCASGERFARASVEPPAIELWDRRRRLAVVSLPDEAEALAIGPRGKRVAAIVDGELRAWSWVDGALVAMTIPGLEPGESWEPGKLELLSVSERGLLANSRSRGLVFLPFRGEDAVLSLVAAGFARQGTLNRQGTRALIVEATARDRYRLTLRELVDGGRIIYEAPQPSEDPDFLFSRDGTRAYWLERGRGLMRLADGALKLLYPIADRATGFLMISPDERRAAFGVLEPFTPPPDADKLMKSLSESYRFEVLNLTTGVRILRFKEPDTPPAFAAVNGDDGLWGVVGKGELRLRRWSATFEPAAEPEAPRPWILTEAPK